MGTTKKLKSKKAQSMQNSVKGTVGIMKKAIWKKVKIKGKVISHEGADFEGLIGLEVLKDYDPTLIGTAKPRITSKQKTVEQRKQLKAKTSKIVSKGETKNTVTEYSEKAQNDIPEPDSTKNRLKTRNEKQSVQRQKQKLKEKQTSKDSAKNLGLENIEITENKDKRFKNDRFVLLRPPPPDVSHKDDGHKVNDEFIDDLKVSSVLNDSSDTLKIDDIQDWNGLGIPECILRALAENGFKSPTRIQAMTLPAAIMGKKDILGAAETGSGKTLAFGIPILAGILELKAKQTKFGIRKVKESNNGEEILAKFIASPISNDSAEQSSSDSSSDESEDSELNCPLYAVVLTPTRELAVQVKEHLVAVAKYTNIKVAAIFGGLSVAKQERILRKCPEIVVATPGRFWELYNQENSHLNKLDDLSFLVIDEADRMLEKDHFEELSSLLKVINANETKKKARQNFVFSATLTLVHDLPDHMQRKNTGKRPRFLKMTPGMKIQRLIAELGISQPKIVDITSSQQTAQTLTECRLLCPIDHKDYYLYYFLQRHPGRTIVFCNSIDCVKRLAALFGLLKCSPLPLHANMIQKQRLKNLERFRSNPKGLLIATDVAARGLDIPSVEHVIHFQVPRTSENYIHRSGRTARANRNGITVMFMEPGEVKLYVKLYKTLDRSEDLPLFPISNNYLAEVKTRVNLAREVDKQELKLKRNQTEIGWMKKHAKETDMIIDGFNDESHSEEDEDPFIIERRRDFLRLRNARSELKSLLAKPIFPKNFSFKYPTSSGQLEIPDVEKDDGNCSDENSAIKAMKGAIEEMKLAKKIRNKKKK